jgi:hypothetical protein
VIRPNALGNFKDLLTATAKSPAMLFYLDNFESIARKRPMNGGQQIRIVASIKITGQSAERERREQLKNNTI